MNPFDFNGKDLETGLAKYTEEVSKLSFKCAISESNFKDLSDHTKNIISLLSSKFEGSEAFCERMARATDGFKDHQQGLNAARREFLIDKANLDGARIKWEFYSRMITKRSEELRKGLR